MFEFIFKCLSNPPYESFQTINASQLSYNRSDAPLGSGGFSSVYLGRWGWHKVAIKEFKTVQEQSDADDSYACEVIMHVTMKNHPNITLCFGGSISASRSYLIFEYMSGGNLQQYLYDNPLSYFNKSARNKFALQIAQGLDYLWSLKIVHRDIKSSNILLDGNENAKIADFGLAIQINQYNNSIAQPQMGSFGWMPPEAFAPGRYTETYDIWPYGFLLWMLASNHEWETFRQVQSLGQLFAYGRAGFTETIDSATSKDCEGLLTLCWDKNPKKRPKAREIVGLLENGLKLTN